MKVDPEEDLRNLKELLTRQQALIERYQTEILNRGLQRSGFCQGSEFKDGLRDAGLALLIVDRLLGIAPPDAKEAGKAKRK